ncbi:MAG: 3-phosphoshikimate 1-carboxyvinyltransferase [Anaerolineae bacterium]|jgi:3-phosphoshikimate 1-carboxyvinyltransferase|nr:3-phosphoshikimate 1-carboxyvinyltransferase [Anaerolineae bacterium]MBT7190677.1 3-phosphoshikimate 1-carboxyvinyltransferase [Anaerolineae bacterium]MBT7989040.1 3-phosphoshikimate 1-carboxyvinyltransferase [Anaerolineae bacterium]
MLKTITPILHPLNASVRVPGSKSLTNRALLISALADGKTTLTNALFSDDSHYFANALKALGFEVSLDEEKKTMSIVGLGGKISAKSAELFIGNAGTAARFLTAFLTLSNGEYILDGEPRMRERPIGDLVNALTPLGAEITQHAIRNKNHSSLVTSPLCPPLKITASGLAGGKTQIAGNVSSQYLSALLMTAPFAENPVEIQITTELYSKPYVDMTLSIMRDFDVEVKRKGYQVFKINPTQYAPRNTYVIESDASAASYFFAAPAICGGTVRVENITRKSVQGDIDFLDILAKMGCEITEHENAISVTGTKNLTGVDVDMRHISDTAQTLAAIAPFASSPTHIHGIASARVKETDRVSAVCAELRRLSIKVEEFEDGMKIYPSKNIQATTVQTYNDHRMAMAFSLIGLRENGVEIRNPSCVSKTFPSYFDVLDELRE